MIQPTLVNGPTFICILQLSSHDGNEDALLKVCFVIQGVIWHNNRCTIDNACVTSNELLIVPTLKWIS